MHYQKLTPKEIQQFIEEYKDGRNICYILCKEDTQEAINDLHSLSYVDYDDVGALFDWLLDSFEMRRNSNDDSFYRAFLTLYNDEILNFRLSRHYATEKSTSDAFVRNGQPDIEYHLIIERVPSTSNSPPIASNTDFFGTAEVIFEVSFNDFKNNSEREKFANELILYLTYGKGKGKRINENKQYKTNRIMNKKLIRLTENDLHKIVKRSVNKVLREGINDITPLSTHIQNNQDADLETLGNIVDGLRKVQEGGVLRKWNPTIAARLKNSGLVDTDTIQAVTEINLLIYRLGNMDFSHKRVYNGETFNDTWNRWQREDD